MDKETLHGMWNYYLTLENDLDNTSRYIEPQGQENVYSFEFAKLLILACTEVEAVFKAICYEVEKEKIAADIGTYKSIVLGRFPKIVEATVIVKRLGRNIEPFKGWDSGPLSWWGAYQNVKHSRESHFPDATYINATTAIAALYILIFYLAEMTETKFDNHISKYIDSEYSDPHLLCSPFRKLPDFVKH